jgi:hypothetical protein
MTIDKSAYLAWNWIWFDQYVLIVWTISVLAVVILQ